MSLGVHTSSEKTAVAPGPTLRDRIINLLPYLVLSLSLITTLIFWSKYDRSLDVRSQTTFDNRTHDIVSTFFVSMIDDEQILRGAAGLFNASEEVTRDEWRRYVSSLALEKNFPGIQGIGFSELVRPEDLERHLRRVRAEGFPQYRILPEGARQEYTSIVYLEPFDWRNRRAFGYDMFSEPVRREAMEKARDKANAAVAGPVTLMQETEQDRQTGLLMYLPVYRRGVPLDTVAQRRAALKGYAYSPIRVKDFMSSTFPRPPADVGFRIFTDIRQGQIASVFDSVKDWHLKVPNGYQGELQKTVSVERYGRRWQISFQSLPELGTERREKESTRYLAGGLTVSLLLGIIAFMLRSAHASALATARALQESEGRYRQLSEGSPAYITTFLPDGTITYVNPAYADSAGRTQQELVGLNIFESLLPEFQAQVRQEVAGLSPQHPTETHEEARYCPDRGIVWQQWTNRATFNDQGRIIQVQGVGQDITARKKVEEERARLEQQMVQAQKLESLGILAGGVAHDFNNLLTAIMGNVELSLLKLPEDSAVTPNLQNVQKAAGRAADLAKQMLAYSGKGRFVIEAIDLNQLVEELRNILQASISRNAELVLKLNRPIAAVEADANQLRQVLMNLVINASEAIGERNGTITIGTGRAEFDRENLMEVNLGEAMAEGEYVYLEVADTGSGIGKEVLAKLFDPFFTTKFTGRGLGLAAVHGIVRGHKGGIKVESEPGKGSRFTVLLPASKASPQGAEVPAPEAGVDGWKGHGKILLVDDEESVRAIGERMLREMGFEPVLAGDGHEALALFKENRGVRAVILDLTMPKMDGEQCFRELRQLDPEVKVIMSSGFTEQDVAQKFPGKELSGFVQKPYNLQTLKEVMRKL